MSVQTMSSQSESVQASAVQASALAVNKPVLNLGDQGAAVTELQNLLNGYANYLSNGAFSVTVDGDPVDGVFGPLTLNAVRAFQRQVFLPKNGTVANSTWQALYLRGPVNMPTIQFGSTGPFVTLLKKTLVSLGYLLTSAGPFDGATKTGVINYQIAKSLLPINGVVDAATWFSLSKQYRP